MGKSPLTYTTPWDPIDHLKTEEDIVNYLEAAIETGDSELISAVQDDIARVRQLGAEKPSLPTTTN